MENVISLSAHRRPASLTRSYTFTGPPFGESVSGSIQDPGAFVSVKEPEPPSPVATAAKALARGQMGFAELTPRQKLEARLLRPQTIARDADFQKLWQLKADQIALSISGPFEPLPDGHLWIGFDPGQSDGAVAMTFDAKERPIRLWPWLLVGVAVAIAIAVTPMAWLGA